MKITLAALSTKELATLAERLIMNAKSGKHPEAENHPLVVVMEDIYNSYDKVYGKNSSSGMGPQVAAQDVERDNLFRGITQYLKGYVKLKSMDNRDEAVALLDVLIRYDNTDMLNYAEETAQLKKLLEELEKPEISPKVDVLNLKKSVEGLKKAQAGFEEIFSQQGSANAELRNSPSASTMRKTLEGAIRDYLNVLIGMKKVSSWDVLYSEVNEIVKASRSNNPGGEEPPSTPDAPSN